MPWASYQIRQIAACACAGNARNVFSRHRVQRKSLVSNPGMHYGTCVTHVPWWMSGSLTRGGGENVPGIPGACATRNFTYLARGPWSVIDMRRWTCQYQINKRMPDLHYFMHITLWTLVTGSRVTISGANSPCAEPPDLLLSTWLHLI